MVIKAHLDTARSVLDDRREPRRAMQLETSGTLPGGAEANVTVHNLSTAGLLLETDLALEEGEVIAIELPEVGTVDANVVWHSDRLYGCAFEELLDEGALAAAQLQGQRRRMLGSPNAPSTASPTPALAQVAEALDVSKPTVWAWEKGKARPLPERIDAIADALGVSVDELGETGPASEGSAITQDCRLRIATAFGTDPNSVRIMIEV